MANNDMLRSGGTIVSHPYSDNSHLHRKFYVWKYATEERVVFCVLTTLSCG